MCAQSGETFWPWSRKVYQFTKGLNSLLSLLDMNVPFFYLPPHLQIKKNVQKIYFLGFRILHLQFSRSFQIESKQLNLGELFRRLSIRKWHKNKKNSEILLPLLAKLKTLEESKTKCDFKQNLSPFLSKAKKTESLRALYWASLLKQNVKFCVNQARNRMWKAQQK